MRVMIAVATLWLAAAGEKVVPVVQAPDTPVRLEHVTVITPSEGPPVLLYAATNTTDTELDQFTVMVYVFDAEGVLKARQIAPGRRTLEPRSTKYSAMVLDGSPIAPDSQIIVGVNQAQRVGSDAWWRTELQSAAEALVKKPKP